MTLDLDQLRTLPLPQLRHLKDKLARAKQIEKDSTILFFKPHEKQYRFYCAANFHRRYMRTGNRFGKSELGAAEDVAFALGYRPWMESAFDIINGKGEVVGRHEGYPGHPLATLGIPQHSTKGIIVTSDWDKSTEIFTSEEEGDKKGKLLRYIPKSAFLDQGRNHSGAIDRVWVRHRSGGTSVIRLDTIKSFKQNPLAFESSDTDWAHFDEPPPEKLYKAVIRGFMDRDGSAWFTCTPLTEPWIDAKFVPDLEEQLGETPRDADASTDQFWMDTGCTDDNPHISKEAIERVMSEYTDDERLTRRSGNPAAYAGLVYKEFSWPVHVQKDVPKGWLSWDQPPPDHCIYIANDYHFRKNNASLFIAIPPDGPAIVFHEIWQQLSMDEEVQAYRDVLRGRSYQPIMMDPLASTPNKVSDLTAMDEYRMRGLAVLPATKDPVNGIRAVKALLKARGRGGLPAIIFARHLKRTLFEIARGFIWDGEENKPIKENDDMMECLYRLVLNGLSYIEPAQDSDYQIIQPRSIPTNVLDFDFGQREPDLAAERRSSYSKRYAPDAFPFFEDHAIL